MEKINILQGYANRQVVLSVFWEDELMTRDGFLFDRIQQNSDRILFIRNNRTTKTLHRLNIPFHVITSRIIQETLINSDRLKAPLTYQLPFFESEKHSFEKYPVALQSVFAIDLHYTPKI